MTGPDLLPLVLDGVSLSRGGKQVLKEIDCRFEISQGAPRTQAGNCSFQGVKQFGLNGVGQLRNVGQAIAEDWDVGGHFFEFRQFIDQELKSVKTVIERISVRADVI